MTAHSQAIQPFIAIWIGKRPRLISKKLTRRVFRASVILILALVILLIAARPVVAILAPSAG
jgi:K+-transporting ATPase A subunit